MRARAILRHAGVAAGLLLTLGCVALAAWSGRQSRSYVWHLGPDAAPRVVSISAGNGDVGTSLLRFVRPAGDGSGREVAFRPAGLDLQRFHRAGHSTSLDMGWDLHMLASTGVTAGWFGGGSAAWDGTPEWTEPFVSASVSLALVALVGTWPAAARAARRAATRTARRRLAQGRCVACGYDRRASAGRCPECGAAAEVPRRRLPPWRAWAAAGLAVAAAYAGACVGLTLTPVVLGGRHSVDLYDKAHVGTLLHDGGVIFCASRFGCPGAEVLRETSNLPASLGWLDAGAGRVEFPATFADGTRPPPTYALRVPGFLVVAALAGLAGLPLRTGRRGRWTG